MQMIFTFMQWLLVAYSTSSSTDTALPIPPPVEDPRPHLFGADTATTIDGKRPTCRHALAAADRTTTASDESSKVK